MTKTISQENIPMLIEMCLPIWQAEIERIQALDVPSRDDIRLTIQLSKCLGDLYMAYRVLKAELRKETSGAPLNRFGELLVQAQALRDKNVARS